LDYISGEDQVQKNIDPITLEVIYHRLKSIADEMEGALLRSSFSTIVKEILRFILAP
jgi:N-methylhydantoinase B/oxoprolinase/acetone carboxylase alpha subunit